MVEPTNRFREQPGSAALLLPRQAGEGLAVPAHRLVPVASEDLADVLEDQAAPLGLASRPMALQAPGTGDAVPDPLLEVLARVPATRGAGIRHDVLAAHAAGKHGPRAKDQ